MSKYVMLKYINTEPDPECVACDGSGQMYGCEDSYVDCCECGFGSIPFKEQYSSEAEVEIAIQKQLMLDKLSGIEHDEVDDPYGWEEQ